MLALPDSEILALRSPLSSRIFNQAGEMFDPVDADGDANFFCG